MYGHGWRDQTDSTAYPTFSWGVAHKRTDFLFVYEPVFTRLLYPLLVFTIFVASQMQH